MLLIFISLVFFIILSTFIFNLKKQNLKFLLITIYSCTIYYLISGKWLLLFALLSTITFIAGANAEKSQKRFIAGLTILVTTIVILKIYYPLYLNVGNFNLDLGKRSVLNVALPIGFSIYVLQSISYLLDVRKGKIKAIDNAFCFFALSSYFPQLLGGPVSHYRDLAKKFTASKNFDPNLAIEGLILIAYGLLKKVMVGDRLLQIFIDMFELKNTANLSLVTILLAPVFLFIEYSALIDIVRGLSKIFNLDLMENYNSPLTQRRFDKMLMNWNLSLYQWGHDYIYLPLCSISSTKKDRIFWLLLIFFLLGLWLGGAKIFYLSTVMFIFFLLERMIVKFIRMIDIKMISVFYKLLSWFFSYIGITVIGFILVAPNFQFALYVIKNLVLKNIIFFETQHFTYLRSDIKMAIIASLVFVFLENYKKNIKKIINELPVVFRWGTLSISIIMLLLFYINNAMSFLFVTI